MTHLNGLKFSGKLTCVPNEHFEIYYILNLSHNCFFIFKQKV